MIDIIVIFCLSYIITTTDFPLVVWIKKYFGIGENRTLKSKYKFIDKIYQYVHKIFNCPICCSFWLMLIFTLSIKYAIISYFVMDILSSIIELIKSNIKY